MKKIIVGYKLLNKGDKINEIEICKGVLQGNKRRVLDYEMNEYHNGRSEFFALYWKKHKDGKKHYITRTV